MDSEKPDRLKEAQDAVREILAEDWEKDGYKIGPVTIHVLIDTPEDHSDRFVYMASAGPAADSLSDADRIRLAESLVKTANDLWPVGTNWDEGTNV